MDGDQDEIAVKVDRVGKVFKLPHEKSSSIKGALINSYRKKSGYEMQEALKDISLEIKKGEFFGIVGRNGSGKSTLLKLLAGIYSPSTGSVVVNGTLTPFIELGVGFNPELTGRENVFLNGALLGFNRKEMLAMYKDIVKFAELERFMDQKLKNYSSGMQVRLAFSIAIRAHSDILLIDEVLAVGDSAFQQKCFDYFRVLKKQKKTVIFVSHDKGVIESFCDRCALIDNGELKKVGLTGEILRSYNDILLEREAPAPTAKQSRKSARKRWGTRNMEIISAYIKNGAIKSHIFHPEDKISIVVKMKAHETVRDPVYGVVFKRSDEENPVFVTNTKIEKIKTGVVKKGQTIETEYVIDNIFGNGSYSISLAIANTDGTLFYDWRERLIAFKVNGWDDTHIAIHPRHTIDIKGEQ